MLPIVRLKYALLVISLVGICSLSVAQAPPAGYMPGGYMPGGFGALGNNIPGQDIYNNGTNPYAEEDEKNKEQPADSVKRRPRKPLESFYFDDSLRATRIFAWNVDPQFNTIQRQTVDTLMELFQIDYRFQRQDIGVATLGNLGGAAIPLNYFRRPQWQNFSFVQPWSEYILTPEKVLFYNAKIPYSRLSFEMSGQTKLEENLFNFIISHNISPSTSVNFTYTADGTKGMYMHQKALARNLSVNIAHTGKRYAIHGGYIYNHGNISENGGIKDDREIIDTVLSNPDQVTVNLSDSRNVYRGHTFWYTQSYGIPLRKQRDDELTIQKIPSIYIGQSLNYTLFKKTYEATNDTIYKTNYINPLLTHDSVAQQMLDINAFVQIQPYNRDGVIGLISAGIGTEFAGYYQYVPTEYQEAFGAGGKDNKNSTYVYADIRGKVSRYLDWDASAKYYLFGYRTQDITAQGHLRLSAYIKQKPITLDAAIKLSLTTPDYWTQSFFSNHYAWSNSFNKENAMLITAKFSVPSINLYMGGDYTLTTGKVYYDQNALPKQSNEPLSVMGFYLQKDFRIGGFHLNHRVLAQFSSNHQVAPVPLVSAFLSYYFEFNVVKQVLRMQVGIDGRYNTKYYAFGYNPAIGQFYNQREKELGGYPYLDAFVNAKWKRMRILLKLQHFNANLFGERNYFQVLHYPQNRMMFKIGVSWSFYD